MIYSRCLTLTVFLLAGCIEAEQEGSSGTIKGMDIQQTATGSCPSVAGSWELVEIRETAQALSGEFESDPEYQEAPTLKVLNETHWMFIRQSAESFIHAQGGRYTLDSLGKYTEHVGYSAIPQNIDQSFTFNCIMEGDSIWHHQGGQGDMRYDEIWRRVQ